MLKLRLSDIVENQRRLSRLVALMAIGPSIAAASELVTVSGDWALEADCATGYELRLEGQSGKGTLVLDMKAHPMDLSQFSHLALDLENRTQAHLDIRLKTTSEDLKGDRYLKGRFFMDASEKKLLRLFLYRNDFPQDHAWTKAFGRLRGLPGGHQSHWLRLDNSSLSYTVLTVSWEGRTLGKDRIFISMPRGYGAYTTDQISPEDLPKPLLDTMGQLVGEDWEGRVQNVDELAADGARDLAQYENHPVQAGFTEYGGWKNGPRFAATGHFYTKKVEGKWWFVDPEGYLFWSLGVTGAGRGVPTPISDREEYFPELSDSTFWREVNNRKSYDFILGNLYRKYGKDWERANQQVTFGRMRSWGLNTSGAWSVPSVLGQGMIPYTLILHPRLQELGKLDKVPDPFSPVFQKSLVQSIKTIAKTYGGDPWNLGVFIHNELHWGKGTEVAREVINLDQWVPAKKAMQSLLKKKYGQIESLNKAWGTEFSDFKSIRGVVPGAATEAYKQDLAAFTDHHADTYFALCAATLKEYMPGHLYLGCRFHGAVYDGSNTIVQKVASRHVDVMSYNIYNTSIDDALTHQEVERPILIGEFHFGTGSHGVWGYGLVSCNSVEEQAALYQAYVNEAVEHPNFIGAHWFQWSDHPTTGRYDGENYRIGFVSIVNRPYETLTGTIQKVSSGMYSLRSSGE